MSEQDDLNFLYDEDAAIQHIRNFISSELKEKLTEDDIVYIIDLLYEYYEEAGLVEASDEMVDIDEDKAADYITKALKKDKEAPRLTLEEVLQVVRGEFDYSDSVGLFE